MFSRSKYLPWRKRKMQYALFNVFMEFCAKTWRKWGPLIYRMLTVVTVIILSRFGDRWRFIKLNYEVITNTNNCPAREPPRRQRSPLLSELAQLAQNKFGRRNGTQFGQSQPFLTRTSMTCPKTSFWWSIKFAFVASRANENLSAAVFQHINNLWREISSHFITWCKFNVEKWLPPALSCLWKSRVFSSRLKILNKKDLPLYSGTAVFSPRGWIFIYTPDIRHRKDVNGRL